MNTRRQAIQFGVTLIIAGGVVAVKGCQGKSAIAQVAVGEITSLEPIIWVDVRTPPEYEQGHIPESMLVPLRSIELGSGVGAIAQLAQDNPEATIILYCERGPRSYRAYQLLAEQNLKIVALTGGIQAWYNAHGD